ncbi:hypothetical protein [Motiliproteus sp. MSK22-1]|uniref:hypothetical protein n=1 Tax=Motiliproteus sp. MSK22-1 TaxID=1897630 RepID=UPI000976295B|nr:hypothetical protein [Motiliproteus sp. MSK22-1]OMH30789.1 hypothetical protein BGP75_17335 [Motiliproteus sp. MSK22-1]
MKLLQTLLFSLSLTLSLISAAEGLKGEQPGDDFRQTANRYMEKSNQAFGKARSSQGETRKNYQRMGFLYEEMAAIKRRAARLADKNRWQDISWERYHSLEKEMLQLRSTLLSLGKPSLKKTL